MTKPDFWTLEKIALLGTESDYSIAKRLDVSQSSVWRYRRKHGIPSFGLHYGSQRGWGETDLALLRSYTDSEIAKMTYRSSKEVAAKRKAL